MYCVYVVLTFIKEMHLWTLQYFNMFLATVMVNNRVMIVHIKIVFLKWQG